MKPKREECWRGRRDNYPCTMITSILLHRAVDFMKRQSPTMCLYRKRAARRIPAKGWNSIMWWTYRSGQRGRAPRSCAGVVFYGLLAFWLLSPRWSLIICTLRRAPWFQRSLAFISGFLHRRFQLSKHQVVLVLSKGRHEARKRLSRSLLLAMAGVPMAALKLSSMH